MRVTTPGVYALSPNSLEHLKQDAIKYKNPKAANALARYYQQGNQNFGLYVLWLQRASDFGSPDAQLKLAELEGNDPEKIRLIGDEIAKAQSLEVEK